MLHLQKTSAKQRCLAYVQIRDNKGRIATLDYHRNRHLRIRIGDYGLSLISSDEVRESIHRIDAISSVNRFLASQRRSDSVSTDIPLPEDARLFGRNSHRAKM